MNEDSVNPVRVLIVHRNELFRQCLSVVLSKDEDFELIDVDATHADRLEVIEECRPDVILIDCDYPQVLAVKLTEDVRTLLFDTKVIVLVSDDEQQRVIESVAAGARGCVCVTEESALEDLGTAIREVVRGGLYCSRQIVHSVFHQLSNLSHELHWLQRVESIDLTPREIEVLELIAERLSNKQVAKRLSVSVSTVKNHVHSILDKLQVDSRHQAVEYAFERKWISNSTR